MSYDYSPEFLTKHGDLVKKIIQIAATGEVLVYDTKDWDEIKRRQILVNNVLANMERNMPDYKDIRKRVRGWTAFGEEDSYRLYVGIPRHKIAGRPPGRPKDNGESWRSTLVPIGDADRLKYEHPVVMTEHNDWVTFVGKVSMLPNNYYEATLRTGEPMDLEKAADYFSQPLEHKGWVVHLTEQSVTFKRIGM